MAFEMETSTKLKDETIMTDGHSMYNSLLDACESYALDSSSYDMKKYLHNMPRNRCSAEMVMSAMTEWEIFELYNVLLTDFEEFLTEEERCKITEAYRSIFDISIGG